jgi:hypothetical protein
MKEYEVTVSAWMEDGEGVGKLRTKGDKIKLTSGQAEWLKRARQIKDCSQALPAQKPEPKAKA